ncbi:MAG: lipopolysaccharide kinase InaA family protein [Planctomycetota bacterium]|nr:lipopolysaccharide kinase InaA family protein [Planctomycetota bacterium]
MNPTLLVAEDLEDALAAAGVTSAKALLDLGLGPDETSVRKALRLKVKGTSGRFYFKGYRYPTGRKRRKLLGRGTLFGRAPELREFEALRWLRGHDLPAVRPVAACALHDRRQLMAQALLTEWVKDAPDLAARLATQDDPVRTSSDVRLKIAAALGSALARMHLHDFVHADCHARNVIVRLEDDEPRIWLLDCRRGRVVRPVRARRGALYDLACLRVDLRPAVEPVFTGPEWTHLLMSYLGTEVGAAELDARVQPLADQERARQERRAARRERRS